MNEQQQAAANLIKRAMKSNSASVAELLINAAKRLAPELDTEQAKTKWLEKWLLASVSSRPEMRKERITQAE